MADCTHEPILEKNSFYRRSIFKSDTNYSQIKTYIYQMQIPGGIKCLTFSNFNCFSCDSSYDMNHFFAKQHDYQYYTFSRRSISLSENNISSTYDSKFSLNDLCQQYHINESFFFDTKNISLAILHIFISVLFFYLIRHCSSNSIFQLISKKQIVITPLLFKLFFAYSFEAFDETTQTLTISDSTEFNNIELYKEQEIHVIIGDSVKEIIENAFKQWKLLTVEIGNSVTSIESFSFYQCTNLVNVNIPDLVTSIESYAFSYCSSLETVIFGENLQTIGRDSFQLCESLKNITISKSVSSIDPSAFTQCSNLQFFIVSEENNYYSESNGILYDKTYSSIICYPLGISNETFDMPNSVTNIGEYAFYYCSSLKNVKISENTISIESFSFYQCTNLVNVNIPDLVTSIESYAFSYCSSLETVIFGENLQTIGRDSFQLCESLKNITISKSVSSIDPSAFTQCSNLQFFIVSEENNYYSESNGILYDKTYSSIICYPLGISNETFDMPNSVTNIGEYAFYYCSSLKNVKISENTISIESFSFYQCTNLVNVNIPDLVTSIESYAFSYCSSLETVIFGENLQTIGRDSFQLCESLTCIYFKGYNSISVIDGAFDNIGTSYVMTSNLYQNSTFGTLNVSKGTPTSECNQYLWMTSTYTQSNSYTQSNTIYSKTFTRSNVFTASLQPGATYVQTIIYTHTITQTIITESLYTHTITPSKSSYTETIFIFYQYTVIAYTSYFSYYSGFFTILQQNTDINVDPNKNTLIIIIVCVCAVVIIIIVILVIVLVRIRSKKRSTVQSIVEEHEKESKEVALSNFSNISNIEEDPFAKDFKENVFI